MDDDTTSALPRSTAVRRFSAREVIYREGDRDNYVYRVRSGLVKLIRYLEDGHARIVRLQERDDILGLDRLADPICSHTAIAVSDVELEQHRISQFHHFGRVNTEMQPAIIGQCLRDLKQADRWIAEFSTGSIRNRVAYLLLFLAGADDRQGDAHLKLLTVQESAEILGVTHESVSRVLARLKRAGALEPCADGQTYRLDRDLLWTVVSPEAA